MMNISDIRSKYPEYDDLSDMELANKLHAANYSDIPKAQFMAKIGLVKKATEQSTTYQSEKEKGSFIDPLMQGATFGWADELGGLGARLGAALAGATEERQNLAQQREMQGQREALRSFSERNPWTSTGLTLVGSIPSSFALGIGQTPLRMAELGAAGGGIAGMGAADENKAAGGLLGIGAGGAMAAAVPAAVNLAQRAIASGKSFVTPIVQRWMNEPQTRAGQILSDQLQAGGVTPASLTSRARQLGPEGTLAEAAGPPGVVMGQGVIQSDKTGNARLMAARNYGKRTPGMSNRLRGAIAETTGVTERLQPSLDAVRSRQVQTSKPLYEKAYSESIPMTDTLESILKRPPVRAAFKEAKDAAETVGEELPPLFSLNDLGEVEKTGVVPDLRAWDRIKQGIDRLIENETDKVTGRVSPKGRDYAILKSQLLKELDTLSPTYRDARMAFAGDASIESAMRTGERFLGMKTREVHSAVGNMNNSEREAFLVGAVEAMREKIGGAKSGQMRSFNFLEQDKAWEKLRAMFPAGREGDRLLAKLKRSISNERTLNETVNDLLRGSQTALREQASDVIGRSSGIPTATEVLSSPTRAGVTRLIQSGINAIGRERQATLDELSRMLFEPGMTQKVISEMQRRGIPKQQVIRYINGVSKGSAALAPAAGYGLGSMVE